MRITVSQLRRIIREEVARSYEQKQFNEIFGFGKKKDKSVQITFSWICPKEYANRVKENTPSLSPKLYAANLLDIAAKQARTNGFDRDNMKSHPDGLEGNLVIVLPNPRGDKNVDDVKKHAEMLANAANQYLLNNNMMKSSEHEGLHVENVKEV